PGAPDGPRQRVLRSGRLGPRDRELREGAPQGAQGSQPALRPRSRLPQSRGVRPRGRVLQEGARERPGPLAVAAEPGPGRGLRPEGPGGGAARIRRAQDALSGRAQPRPDPVADLEPPRGGLMSLVRFVLLVFAVFMFLTVLRGLRIFLAAFLGR